MCKCSGRTLNRVLAVIGALGTLLVGIALSAPLTGCATRTGPAIGGLIEAVGTDVRSVFVALQPKEVTHDAE